MFLSLWQSTAYGMIFFVYLGLIFFIGFRASKRENKSFWRALYGLDRGKQSPLNIIEKLLMVFLTLIFGLLVFIFVLDYKLPWK